MQLRTLWVHQGTALLALLLQGSLVLQKAVAAQIPNHEDEPPPDLVEKMSSWLSKQRCIDWNDLQAFGKLTDAQVDLLWYQRVNENLHADIPDLQKGREPSLHPVWNRWALRLLASLTPQQRQQAKSPAGLSINGLTQEQRTLFELVANTGVDVHALPQSKDKRPVLYLQENRWPNGALRSLQLHTVDLEPYCHETFVTLLLNSTAQGGYSGPVH
ncbi:hypothetical protein CTKA_02479 [Chthonomonas calidirosea]|uniref:Uncharacterized protein n=2 Tax=Chthonomonas TaxID=1077265 RepID=S0EUR2_CHTCT|nr:hypothetical protein [Chthonomonas calidirosea]CCW35437.1 hypothetical protein CCALI_01621 [Chthonomonas calidirosea T49]CEK20280.1 hypothetical protein CTKA_02479 [Chthonomonas calidirosea]